MTSISTTTLDNGLPLHRIALEGTRAVTILVAFDAGARTERPEENGMAHFLEHLVFKGGEKFPHYRDVNETAERLGGVLNAYTSHDLVAFHITAAPSAGRKLSTCSRTSSGARRSTPRSSTASAASSSRRSPGPTTSPRRCRRAPHRRHGLP